jgi:hypothetical protein
MALIDFIMGGHGMGRAMVVLGRFHLDHVS